MLSPKMAGSASAAEKFCNEMLERIAPLREQEYKRLKARKVADEGRKRKHAECDGDEGKIFHPYPTPLQFNWKNQQCNQRFKIQGHHPGFRTLGAASGIQDSGS